MVKALQYPGRRFSKGCFVCRPDLNSIELCFEKITTITGLHCHDTLQFGFEHINIDGTFQPGAEG